MYRLSIAITAKGQTVSNIEQLKRQALAARLTGWDFGNEELPIDPTTIVADQIREIEAFTVRCRICGAHSASGNPCTHGARQ